MEYKMNPYLVVMSKKLGDNFLLNHLMVQFDNINLVGMRDWHQLHLYYQFQFDKDYLHQLMIHVEYHYQSIRHSH
jgi:hypothetical protein